MGRRSRGHIVEHQSGVPRLIVVVFAIAGLAALITIGVLLAPDVIALVTRGEPPNDNRTWLTRVWTQSDRDLTEIETMVEILEDNGIKLAYVEAGGWHGLTNEYIELPYSQNFIQRFRNSTSEIQLYAWLKIDSEQIEDPASRQQLATFAELAIKERGLDGVHLQTRSIPSDNEQFILLLRDLRAAIGTQAFLSITVPPDRPPIDPDVPTGPPVANDLTWSRDYKKRVALNVNELVLMAHASGLTTADEYEIWLSYQVATYAQILQELQIEMGFVIALPTYAAELGHDPDVENVESAVAGIFLGMDRNANAKDLIDGVGLYPWEETDLLELDAYWELWVQRSP